ncbi:MAG: polysaccharide biosynthesis protein PslH [Acidobacteriota bacterium]|jgi:sugar transferase (PEP-CTERM/EpsH1 system associated)|nr:polysaccharide biosynthesis protein PslH [Acidobacteriota bacterium]
MRILWLKTELLHPVDKGGRIRTYYMLRELKREHEVTYLTLDDGQAAPDARERATEYCHELITIPHRTRAKFTPGFYFDLAHNLVSRLPYFMQKYKSAAMRREIARVTATGKFDVMVCDFLMSSINVPSRVSCPAVLFQHNVEAMIWKRHYEVQRNPLKKAYLYGQWRKAVAYERAACQRFDYVVTVSADDREMTRTDYHVDSVADVTTGVDTEYFRPRGHEVRDPHNLVFTGSMDWLPNEDAIRYFTEQIMPLIKKALPEATLTVVGRNPYKSLLELSRRDPAIIVTGRVEDVRPYMERAAAYVVPLRIGGGTRLKIYEAMAMEKPIVSTTIGAEGLPVQNGEHLLLADTPESFAAECVRVLKSETAARDLGARAAKIVREQFGWDKVAASFAEVCQRAVRSHQPEQTKAQVEEELRTVV